MTLVVALKGKGGVILAADSRGTIGDPRGLTAINDTYDKLFQLTKYAGVVSFGAGELSAQMMHIIRSHQNIRNLENVKDIDKTVEVFRQGLSSIYQGWFRQTPPNQRPVIGYIVGGIDRNDEAKVFTLMSQLEFAPQYHIKGFGLGGVPQYAVYLVHKLYNYETLYENLRDVAVFLISETATQDPKVGGPIKLAEITPEFGFNQLSSDIVKEIMISNEKVNELLSDFFKQGESE